MSRFQWIGLTGGVIVVMLGVVLVMERSSPTLPIEYISESEAVEAVPMESAEAEAVPAEITPTEPIEMKVDLVSLSVTVRNAAGQKVSAAQVTLKGPIEDSTVTDTEGRIHLDRLPKGRYTLTLEHKGFPSLVKRITL